MTPSLSKLEISSRGFYCIHKQTQTESLLGSFSRMFKKFTSTEYSITIESPEPTQSTQSRNNNNNNIYVHIAQM